MFEDVFKAALQRASDRASKAAEWVKGKFRDITWMKQGWATFAGSSTALRDQRLRRFNRERTRPARVASLPNRPTYKNEPKPPRRKHQNDITHVGELFRPMTGSMGSRRAAVNRADRAEHLRQWREAKRQRLVQLRRQAAVLTAWSGAMIVASSVLFWATVERL